MSYHSRPNQPFIYICSIDIDRKQLSIFLITMVESEKPILNRVGKIKAHIMSQLTTGNQVTELAEHQFKIKNAFEEIKRNKRNMRI